ncbi:acyl-CoA dehydrogenase, partial [Aeropyrum pernix]
GGGRWAEIDEAGVLPAETIRGLGALGVLALVCPEELGGQGGGWLEAAIAAEEIGYHDPSMSTAVYTLLNNAWPFILSRHGSPEVAGGIVEKVAKGEMFFGIASTEPGGGSDVAGIKTRAERRGDYYRVYGEKILISGVREALETLDYGGWLLLARTGGEGHRGLSAFAFTGKWDGSLASGLEYSILDTIGRHGISTGILRLDGAEVHASRIVGGEGRGFYVAMEGFPLARILVAAANVGAARWALERAVEWSRERRLFGGRPIASFQGVSFSIAEAFAGLEAARLLVYRAAWTADRYVRGEAAREELNLYSASAKLKAVDTAFSIFQETMKIVGGISFTKEVDVHRGLLGTLSYLVGAEGAQNIMKYIIARDLIGREYVKL